MNDEAMWVLRDEALAAFRESRVGENGVHVPTVFLQGWDACLAAVRGLEREPDGLGGPIV